MGKKKKANSDVTRSRKQEKRSEKKLNPFEVKVNRQKHEVLGRKITKHERGMPGVSRSKAIKRRKQTLLREYEQQFKVNKVVDKRFGEYDASLTQDDKMMKRYAMERAKSGVKNKFNLNEDDELTHYGQSLAEIEKFENPVNSDDDDDDEDKRANAQFVAEQHFGGFLTKKPETEESDTPKTWKEKMGEMILQSKKAKHERQVEKEETERMTEDVDAAWRDLQGLVKPTKKKGLNTEEEPAADDYDQAVRSLKFDVRAQATDRMKSEEEIAKEEKEKLDRLEADRIRRMKGLSDDSNKPKIQHKSADDLDDRFQLEETHVPYVSYREGQLLSEGPVDNEAGSDNDDSDNDNDDNDNSEDEGSEDNDNEAVSDDNSDNDSDNSGPESDNKEESDNEEIKDEKDDEGPEKIVEKQEDEISDDDDDDSGSDDDAADSYDDLLSDLEQELDEPKVVKETKLKIKKAKENKSEEKTREMEKAKKEIPYTFIAPDSYDSLLDVLEGHDLEGQLTIIDRIKKCHHPSLAAGNKEKLETFFKYLVQFYGDLCIQDPPQLEFVDRLLKPLFELTQMSPEQAAQTMITEIADRQAEFKQICDRKAGRGLYPALDTVMLFKLVSVLFPTSDFYHHVTTPIMLFICQILSQCNVHHGRDVVTGLLLCNICLEYVSLSRRLVPEAINFLHGTLFLSCKKESNKYIKVVPPFKSIGKSINLLHVSKPCKHATNSKWSLSKMLGPVIEEEVYDNDEFRIQAVQHCITLLEEYSIIYSDLPSYPTIFTPILDLCKKLPTNNYPESLKSRIEEFISVGEERFTKKLSNLVIQKAKPKPLALMEPQIEDSFDGRKTFRKGTKEFNEKQKLMHKYKKELKGARRELKKDTHFIARKRLNDQMSKDRERKRKVNQLMASLANQEGDYKKMKKGKSSSYF